MQIEKGIRDSYAMYYAMQWHSFAISCIGTPVYCNAITYIIVQTVIVCIASTSGIIIIFTLVNGII